MKLLGTTQFSHKESDNGNNSNTNINNISGTKHSFALDTKNLKVEPKVE